jgi:hypothetical protein
MHKKAKSGKIVTNSDRLQELKRKRDRIEQTAQQNQFQADRV